MDCTEGKNCPNLKKYRAAQSDVYALQRIQALLLHDRDDLIELTSETHITDDEINAWNVTNVPNLGEAT
jgi:hypothetical protein